VRSAIIHSVCLNAMRDSSNTGMIAHCASEAGMLNQERS
jgi:hypothetical protein